MGLATALTFGLALALLVWPLAMPAYFNVAPTMSELHQGTAVIPSERVRMYYCLCFTVLAWGGLATGKDTRSVAAFAALAVAGGVYQVWVLGLAGEFWSHAVPGCILLRMGSLLRSSNGRPIALGWAQGIFCMLLESGVILSQIRGTVRPSRPAPAARRARPRSSTRLWFHAWFHARARAAGAEQGAPVPASEAHGAPDDARRRLRDPLDERPAGHLRPPRRRVPRRGPSRDPHLVSPLVSSYRV